MSYSTYPVHLSFEKNPLHDLDDSSAAQPIVVGRIGSRWAEEFSPSFAGAMIREVAEVIRLHNKKHGLNLILREEEPKPAWLLGSLVYPDRPKSPAAIPVWVWWADEREGS